MIYCTYLGWGKDHDEAKGEQHRMVTELAQLKSGFVDGPAATPHWPRTTQLPLQSL